MTIRWYRGAVVKKQRVKRQKRLRKPKSPGAIPKTKAPNMFKPKSPGVQPPSISLPFVSAGGPGSGGSRTEDGADRSFHSIYVIEYMAKKNEWSLVSSAWKLSSASPLCSPNYAARDCSDAAKYWGNASSWDEVLSKLPGEDMGMWAVSHPGCSCHIAFTLQDKAGRMITLDVYPQESATSIAPTPLSTISVNPSSQFNPPDLELHREDPASFYYKSWESKIVPADVVPGAEGATGGAETSGATGEADAEADEKKAPAPLETPEERDQRLKTEEK
jgi:hypothetical protein